MPASQSRGSPKRRGFRKMQKYFLHYILLAIFCLAITFIMCYTVFFKLDKIKISGCKVYSEKQIVDEIGAQKGESLFQINLSNAKKRLLGELPYLRSVEIKRRFPTTLKVEIQEEEVLGAIYTESGFAIISTTGKVLETEKLTLPEGTPRIVGLSNRIYETGSYLKTSNSKEVKIIPQIHSLKIVSEQLKENGFTDITYYDVSDSLNLQVMVEDRLLMKLGSENDMAYKLRFIRNVLDAKERGEPEFEKVPKEGTLDFSNPPALHTMSISMEKVKNEEAYLDFKIDTSVEIENVAGEQQLEALPESQSAPQQQDTTQQVQQNSTDNSSQDVAVGEQQTQAVPEPSQQGEGEGGTQQVIVNGVVQNTAGGQQTTQPPNPEGQTGQSAPPPNGQPAQPSNGQTNQSVSPPSGQAGQPTSAPNGQSAQPSNGQVNQPISQPNNQSNQQTDHSGETSQSQEQQQSGNVFNIPGRAPIVN